jgi:signal transduction histidine kinase
MSVENGGKSGRQALRPKARILRTIGDELISNETVAIIELVKNAYDADASGVLISFHEPLRLREGFIEVLDDGHGMNLEVIQGAWFEPATPNRKRGRLSESGRRQVLGEKGIGRFAASRLADTLELVTRRECAPQEVRVSLDWRAFDNDDLYLDQLPIEWEERKPQELRRGSIIDHLYRGIQRDPPPHPHGTLLRMRGYRSVWSEEQFSALRKGLSRLVSPFAGDAFIEAFRIALELPLQFAHLGGLVQPPELLRSPHYSVTGNVRADGSYDLTFAGKALRNKSETGTLSLPDGRQPVCGPFTIDLRAWDRDPESLRHLHLQEHATVRDIRRDLDDAAGISIYRDHFRVLPYGEPKNDWLRLDLRRVQNPTLRLSNNQLMGYVQVSSQRNPALRDQSNREGLVENPAVQDLRDLIVEILALLEARRYDVRHPKSTSEPAKAREGLFSGFELPALAAYVKEHRPTDAALLKVLRTEQQVLAQRVQDVQTVLARYQSLATLGTLIDTVLHDGRAPVAGIRNEAETGEVEARRLAARVNGAATNIATRFGRIKVQSDILGTTFRKIEPFGGRKRGRPATITIEAAVSDAFAILHTEIDQVGAAVTLPKTRTSVTVDPAELQQIILNLLQNSLYWLRHVPKNRREIDVRVARSDGAAEILFSDSGPGVPSETRDRIFEPYFSTKPNGVGLGLSIAGEIIRDYYDGTLELLDKGPLRGATFRVVLRRRV